MPKGEEHEHAFVEDGLDHLIMHDDQAFLNLCPLGAESEWKDGGNLGNDEGL